MGEVCIFMQLWLVFVHVCMGTCIHVCVCDIDVQLCTA